MFIVKKRYVRPNLEVEFPRNSLSVPRRVDYPGFIKKEMFFLNNNLEKIVYWTWENEESYRYYWDTNVHILQENNIYVEEYCKQFGILVEKTFETFDAEYLQENHGIIVEKVTKDN